MCTDSFICEETKETQSDDALRLAKVWGIGEPSEGEQHPDDLSTQNHIWSGHGSDTEGPAYSPMAAGGYRFF